jgi:ketosteroid isomerase-like protein
MSRLWTIIGVADVPASVHWYQALFGQPPAAPAHDDFGQIVDADGTVLLCLHQWGAHEHPPLTRPDQAAPGNGLLLFFRVDDYDASLRRARSLVKTLAEEPHVNPSTRTREFSLRDRDGYYVSISEAEAGRSTAGETSAIEALEQRLAAAWVARDRAVIEAVLADDWSVIDPAGQVLTKRQVVDGAFDADDRRIDSMTIDDVQVRLFGTTAVVTGRTRASGSHRGQSGSAVLRFTDVFQVRAGRWQIVASHGTLSPEQGGAPVPARPDP